MSAPCRYCNYAADGEYLCNPTDPNVCGPCQKLHELEQKIKEIRTMLVGLEDERRKLKEQANHNHDKFIHHLPSEIASYIFELCIPDDIMDLNLWDEEVSRYTICAPLVLSAVCRKWRTIAHSTPRLWTTLPLCFEGPKTRSMPTPLLIKEWIDRTGMLPLSITLHGAINDPSMEDTIIPIIDMLNQCSDRWRNIKYEVPIMMDFPYGPALKLHPKRLNTLSVNELRVIDLNFDWNHLTQLTVDIISYPECIEVLLRAPRLMRCTFSIFHYRGILTSPVNPITHLHIQYLELRCHSRLFDFMTCPSLNTLVLHSGIVNLDRMVETLRRSECSLEKLSLIDTTFSTDDDVLLLCQGIPTLQHLRMDLISSIMFRTGDILFEHLTESLNVNGRKQPRYLPALRSLTLDNLKMTSKTWTTLAGIFDPISATYTAEHHRWALKNVTISVMNRSDDETQYNIDDDTLKRILRLREEGVKWKVHFAGTGEDMIELAVARSEISSTRAKLEST